MPRPKAIRNEQKETEDVEVTQPPAIVKSEKKEKKFDRDKYYTNKEIEKVRKDKVTGEDEYYVEVKEVVRREFNTHFRKCKIRTAESFDVSIEDIDSAYSKLNGKKIDRFIVNDLIDRYGFSNGQQMNRSDTAIKAGYSNIRTVELAEDKLKKIIKSDDVIKAYTNYLKAFDTERTKETVDNMNGQI